MNGPANAKLNTNRRELAHEDDSKDLPAAKNNKLELQLLPLSQGDNCMVSSTISGRCDMEPVESVVMSCECCGLEEECTGEYIGGVRAFFGGRWLCGLCSEAVKYEAGKGAAADVEDAVRAHMAFCRMFKRGGPAERVAEGMCQMLRTASMKHRSSSSSSSSSPSSSSSSTPTEHRPLSVGF